MTAGSLSEPAAYGWKSHYLHHGANEEMGAPCRQVHAMTGENGSGKSTLAKIMCGEHQPDARIIEWDGSRLLILDEATSSLSEAAGERLLTVVEAQRQPGVAVLMITHRMGELYRSCTAATVLRDGQLVATVPLPETKEPELLRLMVGRDLGDYYGARARAKSAAATVLTVRGLRTPDGALAPTSFDVRAGEILGVAGLVGSGKSELSLALTCAIRSSGEVRVLRGGQVTLRSPGRRWSAACLLPDRRDRSRASAFR